jgi:hypothetical protein
MALQVLGEGHERMAGVPMKRKEKDTTSLRIEVE